MKFSEINIRDPFILPVKDEFYLYGTRAANFGRNTHGFDVYVSCDLYDWDGPYECFNSTKYGLDKDANWAPEVHEYEGSYYMLATFVKENDLRGTFILKSSSPKGPFVPHGNGALTPYDWECLDGTLYFENGQPYLVFCHEHTQIIDGTICYLPLSSDLSQACGEPKTLFSGSSPSYIEKMPDGTHYVTDGPFMYRTIENELLMIWSTFIGAKYAECLVHFTEGTITGKFEHLSPLSEDDGGHGMIFSGQNKLYLIMHSPNTQTLERPKLTELIDNGKMITFK